MASKGNKKLIEKIRDLVPEETVVILVKTEWNAHITNQLELGCKAYLKANGVTSKTIVVPGAVEIPFAINAYSKSFLQADAFIALACIIKGDTPHFDYVCQSITQGITALNVAINAPVIYGVLTVNTEEQALERIGGKHGHKGEEAAITAIKMIALKRSLLPSFEELPF